jgi:hypothetical protein
MRTGLQKPAMKAVRTVMTAVRGRRYAGMIQHAPSGMHAMIRWAGGSAVHCLERQGRKRQTIRHPKHNLVSVTI